MGGAGAMTDYIARVELHRATEADYERLHDAMERLDFVRWVIGDDSVAYRLPTAQYHMANTDLGMRDAWERATAAANSVKPRPTPWVVVARAADLLWSGLKAWLD